MTHMHHIFWIHVFMMEYVIITIRKIFQHCRLIFSDWNRRYQIELTVPIWLVVKSEKIDDRMNFWAGLLRTSTSSPSWIFEALVPIPKVIVDVLVFVHGLRGWWANFWDTKQESQDGNKEFGNLGRRGRRRPAEAWSG